MEDVLHDFISFNLKCSICGHSLMDEDQLVDGRPGVKLGIKTSKGEGTIILSSIYESFNFRCDVEMDEDEIVEFSCPHCSKKFEGCLECDHCEAPMVKLDLDIGGTVCICTRKGCKRHFLEFDDFNAALYKLTYLGEYKEAVPEGIRETGESKEIIDSGTFLHLYCPVCDKSLIDKGLVKLKVINDTGESGHVFLSPYLNVFTSRSTVFLKEDQVVNDIQCFHCETSLINKGKKCEECGSPAAKVAIAARTKLIDFYICSKKGCRWHGLCNDDLHDIELEDSLEW
ncbi:MAG: hypothetical protein KAT48_13670 [Bacteroidales bacterium]|nr:hypothetical protein [Bacteroidales bacterium]